MTAEEKLKVLRGELIEQGYADNTAMAILIQEKIEELEQCLIADMAHRAMRERNEAIIRPNS